MEVQNSKSPKSLYDLSLNTYVVNLNYNVVTIDRLNILRLLPGFVLADIYFKMSSSFKLSDILMEELSDLKVFARILKFGPARQKMFRCFASLMSNGKPIASDLRRKYMQQAKFILYEKENNICDWNQKEFRQYIDTGLRLGTFLSESGWVEDSLNVLTLAHSLIQTLGNDYKTMLLQLDCLQRLLYAQANFCCFKEAAATINLALSLVENISDDKIPSSLAANLYMQISVLYFLRSEYNLSYTWSLKALKKIEQNTPDKISIDVLRQAAKSCVIKRQFKRANMLISQSVRIARRAFGKHHQKYADALLDYGFFLLNVDSIKHSVKVYEDALEMRTMIFGMRNLNVALAHEDLAYALYVHEYSSGHFSSAKEHVEVAIEIMRELLPGDHLMLASAKRVKALILEEMALDNLPTKSPELLQESEMLHRAALLLSLEAFGEINVQTAKHYGNLGRLYQSMMKFEDAERMHQRAIKIKTDLLGAYDYEVGLSIGHLASLYNYHMKKYREAEELYLKSINISLKLFGDSYSGLEYDYRGLVYVYEKLNDEGKYIEYMEILQTWKVLREGNEAREDDLIYVELIEQDTSMIEITKRFFQMCRETEGMTPT